jgi:hypothetical protein
VFKTIGEAKDALYCIEKNKETLCSLREGGKMHCWNALQFDPQSVE